MNIQERNFQSERVNSKEYWDGRFSIGDWDKYDGELQSAFFSEIALKAFPDWMHKELNQNNWTVIDYGCAEGMGTAVLARHFPKCCFIGIDFSTAAVAIAKEKYPYCEYKVGDITKEIETSDIIFCSNVLEHMEHPYEVFANMLARARRHAIFLLPLKDALNLSEHFFIFKEDFFPLTEKGHHLSYFKIIDCEELGTPYWPGQQLMLIYSDETIYDRSKYQLADLFSNEEYECLKSKLKEVSTHCDQNAEKAAALESDKRDLIAQIEQCREENKALDAQVEQERQEQQRLSAQVEQERQE